MTDPIEVLMDEHRVIEQVLEALETAAQRSLPVDFYRRAVDFIAHFADACHHGKEEDRLFPLLEQRGIPREGGPIGVMCHEHVQGREHVANMRAQIAAGDLPALKRESLAYAALLRQHIQKEDDVLFPMGRSVLTPLDLEKLERSFQEVLEGGDCDPGYRELAARLLREAARTS